MLSLTDFVHGGSGSAWLFIPTALALGALHGLEPGHSKTMMAAFIIAVRGTIGQAILLGLAATFSHTLIVWVLALGGMYFGSRWTADSSESYLQLASAVLMIAVAVWMLWRTWREQQGLKREERDAEQPLGAERRRIDTGHGTLLLEVFEDGVPPRWRVHVETGHYWPAGSVQVETRRPDGALQLFDFADHDDYLESIEEIPEPHAFAARLKLSHGGHAHAYDVAFQEHDHGHGHGHDHAHGHGHGHEDAHDHAHGHGHDHLHPHPHPHGSGLDVLDDGPHDAHEMAHADDIRRRFSGRSVTTGQIVLFGLTGGLVPCPAAITVLLLCLQLRRFALGVALVLAFSIGLAITMVVVGVVAATSVGHIRRRWPGLGVLARRAPYFASTVIICMGLYIGYQGLANRDPNYRSHHHHLFTGLSGAP